MSELLLMNSREYQEGSIDRVDFFSKPTERNTTSIQYESLPLISEYLISEANALINDLLQAHHSNAAMTSSIKRTYNLSLFKLYLN